MIGQSTRQSAIAILTDKRIVLRKLKDTTSLLELALWKIKIDDSLGHGKAMGGGKKKLKIDQTDIRIQCRISCRADNVIENVLPYLLLPNVNKDNDDNEEDNYYISIMTI